MATYAKGLDTRFEVGSSLQVRLLVILRLEGVGSDAVEELSLEAAVR